MSVVKGVYKLPNKDAHILLGHEVQVLQLYSMECITKKLQIGGGGSEYNAYLCTCNASNMISACMCTVFTL